MRERSEQDKRDYAHLFMGMIIGGVVTALGVWCQDVPELTVAPQDEYDAYRLCMQSAGKTRCSMTPQDFVRYYEIKRQLEQSDGETNDAE